jgi:hypothetical protein
MRLAEKKLLWRPDPFADAGRNRPTTVYLKIPGVASVCGGYKREKDLFHVIIAYSLRSIKIGRHLGVPAATGALPKMTNVLIAHAL